VRECGADATKDTSTGYHVDCFMPHTLRIKITPFLLDTFVGEWEELHQAQSTHMMEMDVLCAANLSLTAQLKRLEPIH
jgi:ecotropic viral integration site 5 protein